MTWNEYCISKLPLAKSLYKRCMKQEWDFTNPKTFTEKLWWLKIYDSTMLKTFCADKITCHDYYCMKLGKDTSIPIIKVYDSAKDIKWDELPDRFVIKCNHGSGYNIIVKNKNTIDKKCIADRLNAWMNEDYAFKYDVELHYHLIPHKILIEQYVDDLQDVKVFCFNGQVKFFQADYHLTQHRQNFYDDNWNYMQWLSRKDYPSNPSVRDAKPINFDKIKEWATLLSKDFKFVRVDLFETSNGNLYTGELTFTPGGGRQHYKEDGDIKLGKMLSI